MHYVGCDLHKRETWFYVVDPSGNRILSKSISNKPEQLHSFFSKLPRPFILAVESTYNWYFFVDIAEEYAAKIYMANSYELKAFAKRHKKTDKIDAKLIAEVLRKGYLPTVTIPDKKTRRMRELLHYRMNLTNDRSRNIFRLKSVLDRLGEDSNGDFTTYKRLKEIQALRIAGEEQAIVGGYVESIRSLKNSSYNLDKLIAEEASKDEDVRNLMTIPGISSFSGLLIKNEIINAERFSSFGRLCAYAGLAPRVQQSSSKLIHGSLNMNRRKRLRWILLETVYHFMNAIPRYKRKHEYIARKKGYNASKVVLARDMLKIIYHVLKEKRSFYTEEKYKKGIIRSEAACALIRV